MLNIKITAFIFLFLNIRFASAQNEQKNILLLNMDSSQFYSEVNFEDYIYRAESIGILTIAKTYQEVMGNILTDFVDAEFKVVKADIPEVNLVRNQNSYRTLTDFNQEEYLGMVPSDSSQTAIRSLISKYQADYILSINLYELFPVENSTDEFYHILHYDLLAADLKVIHSGRYIGRDYYLLPNDIEWFYYDFVQDIIFRIKADKLDIEAGSAYRQVKEEFYVKAKGDEKGLYFGFIGGFGAPYGGLGLELAQMMKKADINAGLGYDYGGMKIGLGMRYYFLETGKSQNYFSGLALSYNTGGEFLLGAERDETGGLINPNEASRYKIASDLSLHARLGTAFMFQGQGMIMFTFGYSYPFKRSDPELLEGAFKKSRDKYARFVSPGGLEFSINLMVYN